LSPLLAAAHRQNPNSKFTKHPKIKTPKESTVLRKFRQEKKIKKNVGQGCLISDFLEFRQEKRGVKKARGYTIGAYAGCAGERRRKIGTDFFSVRRIFFSR